MGIGSKKTLEGIVVGDKPEKTCYVMVERRIRHPRYSKVISRRKKYAVHDTENKALVGDKVSIVECRPISKVKNYRLGEILQKAKIEGGDSREKTQ